MPFFIYNETAWLGRMRLPHLASIALQCVDDPASPKINRGLGIDEYRLSKAAIAEFGSSMGAPGDFSVRAAGDQITSFGYAEPPEPKRYPVWPFVDGKWRDPKRYYQSTKHLPFAL